MRATSGPVGVLLLLLCLLCPPSTRPSGTMASASLATASWKTVWADDFQSEVGFFPAYQQLLSVSLINAMQCCARVLTS